MKTDFPVRPFKVSGIAVDTDWALNNQSLVVDGLHDHMLKKGFLPCLDVSPEFEWRRDPLTNRCKYSVSVRGMAVGRARVGDLTGFTSDGSFVDQHGDKICLDLTA